MVDAHGSDQCEFFTRMVLAEHCADIQELSAVLSTERHDDQCNLMKAHY